MACGWFIAELDLSGCRVPIAAEFYKWVSCKQWHDQSEFEDRSGGARDEGKHPRSVCLDDQRGPASFDHVAVLRFGRLASWAKGVKGRSGSWLDGESFDPPST